MKKRKQEFKPDRLHSSWLSRMTPTRKQQKSMLMWTLCGLTLLVLSVIQDVFCSRLRLWGTTTDLVPCGIFLFCLLQGAEKGSVFALVSATLFLLSGSAPGEYSIVLITAVAVLTSLLRQAFLQKGFPAAMTCTAIAMVLYELSTFAVGVMLSYTTAGRLSYFLFSAALSMIAAPILYPIGVAIGHIGGEVWNE